MFNTAALKKFELFMGLGDEHLASISELCHLYSISEGHHIFLEGSKANDVHLCLSGKVDISIRLGQPWNKNVTIHRAGQGEVFGWSALVAPYIYTASAECIEAGEEIRIKGSELLALFKKNPAVGYTVMENLGASISLRLAQTRQKLVEEWLGSSWSVNPTAWGEADKRKSLM